MTFELVIRNTFEAIQFDGNNLREIYDFICKYHGNADEISFEELQEKHCRPNEIPLDIDSTLNLREMEDEFEEKWKDELRVWREICCKYICTVPAKYLPPECIDNKRMLELYRQGWKTGEMYHFFLKRKEGYSELIGICKGDWFTNQGNWIKHYSEHAFESLLQKGNVKQIFEKESIMDLCSPK